MVAAGGKFKSGQSKECRARTGAGGGASGARRRNTEQTPKAATHARTTSMHKLPAPTTPAKRRPASPDLPCSGVALGGGPGVASSKWIRPMRSLARCRPRRIRFHCLQRHFTFTTKKSRKTAATVQKPALKKDKRTEPGPTPGAPRSGPGSSPFSMAGPASAVGGEVQFK